MNVDTRLKVLLKFGSLKAHNNYTKSFMSFIYIFSTASQRNNYLQLDIHKFVQLFAILYFYNVLYTWLVSLNSLLDIDSLRGHPAWHSREPERAKRL